MDAEAHRDDPASVARPPDGRRGRRAVLLAGLAIILVGFNLRATLASLGPVLHDIIDDLALSAGMAALLGTAPVFCLGAFAPLAPVLARRLGIEQVLLAALLLLALGTAARGLGTTAAILGGGLLSGAAITQLATLSPALIKRDFAAPALMTGIFICAMALGATLGAGATVPAMHALGSWQAALALWSAPALLGALAVHAFIRPGAAGLPSGVRPAETEVNVWRSRLAWMVTGFMGLQSGLNFCGFIWLPALLVDRGLSPAEAGAVQSVYIFVQAPVSLASPLLGRLGRDQRLGGGLALLAGLTGFLGCLYLPLGGAWFWAALLGVGQAATFCFSLLMIVLRAPNARVAADLSGMAQGLGYLLAGLSPLAMGVLHDRTGSWALTGPLFALATALAFGALMQAGRAVTIRN